MLTMRRLAPPHKGGLPRFLGQLEPRRRWRRCSGSGRMEGAAPLRFDVLHLGLLPLVYYSLPCSDPSVPDGRVVVLLHGLGNTAKDFNQPQLRNLCRCGRVVIPSLLGSGGSASPRGAEHYTMPAQARCVLLLLRSLKTKELFIVGHSMGGAIALALAEACAAASEVPLARCILYSEPNVDSDDCFGSRPGGRPGTDLSTLTAERAAKVATCRHLVAESDSGELLGRMQAVRGGSNGSNGLPSLCFIGGKNKGQLTSEASLLQLGFPVQ